MSPMSGLNAARARTPGLYFDGHVPFGQAVRALSHELRVSGAEETVA